MVDGVDSNDKKIKGINKTDALNSVRKSEAISQVNKTSKVGAITGVSSTSRMPTREMSFQERSELLQMVEQEAEKLFSNSKIPQAQREAIELAVKQTIDAALVDSGDNDEDDDKEKL